MDFTTESSSLFVNNIKENTSRPKLIENNMIIKIISNKGIAINDRPNLISNTICSIKENVILKVLKEIISEGITWLLLSCGWMSSLG